MSGQAVQSSRDAEHGLRRERTQEDADRERRWPGKQSSAMAHAGATPTEERLSDMGKLRGALQGLSGGGASLPDGVSSRFSQLLGADLSAVRLHTSGAASDAAASMNARAFTHGNHVAFAPGAYDGSSASSQHILAHELVHVVQNQRGGGTAMQLAARMDIGPSGSAIESEAETGAHAITSGHAFQVSSRSALPGISLFSNNEPTPAPAPPPPPSHAAPPPAGAAPTAAPTPGPAPTGAAPTGPAPTGAAPTTAPTGPAPTANGAGSTPAPASTAPDAAGPKPTATPTPTPAGGAIDAKIAEILEQRADPKQKADYAKALGKIEALRLQAVQYGFQKSGFGNTLFQTLVFPTEAVSDHAAQIYSNNAYRGGTWIDKIQAGIEGLRGILHILGDICQIVSAWAGMVAIVAGLIALIGAETGVLAVVGGAIAAIADSVSTIAGLAKICLDIIDILLGLLQMMILLVRAWTTKDPTARARIAQLMHKEAGDMAANVVGVVTAATVLVVTAGVGAGMSKGLSKMFTKEFAHAWGEEIGKLLNPKVVFKGGIAGIAEKFSVKQVGKGVAAAGGGKVVAVAGEDVLKLSVLKRVAGRVTKDREIVGFTTKNQMRGARLVRCNEALRKVGAINSSVIGGGLVGGQLVVASKGPDKSSIAKPGGNGEMKVPEKPSGALTTVQMWPSELDSFATTKGPLKDAIKHVEEQYDRAKEQAGPALAAQVAAKLKEVSERSKKQDAGAKQVKGDAQTGQQQAQQGQQQAKQADDQKNKGKATADKATDETKKADSQAAKMQPPPAKEGALGWVYNHTVGKIGSWISGAQNWLKNHLGMALMWAGGFSKEELDMAGIENEMRTGATQDKESEQQAADTESKDAQVQQAVYELMKDKDADQQAAIQGMAEAQGFMEALEEADKTLAEMIEGGHGYIDAVTPILRHELETQIQGKTIDAAYIAPITGYADAFTQSLAEDATGTTAQQQADGQLDSMHASFEGLDVGTGKGQVAKIVESYRTARTNEVNQARAGAEKIKTAVAAFVGSTDYDGVNANAQALDKLATDFDEQDNKLGDELYRELNALLSAYQKAIDDAVAAAQVVPEDQPLGPVAPPADQGSSTTPQTPQPQTQQPNKSTLPPTSTSTNQPTDPSTP